MEKDHYRGAQRVYAWSFYSQGAEEGKQASAEYDGHALALTLLGQYLKNSYQRDRWGQVNIYRKYLPRSGNWENELQDLKNKSTDPLKVSMYSKEPLYIPGHYFDK